GGPRQSHDTTEIGIDDCAYLSSGHVPEWNSTGDDARYGDGGVQSAPQAVRVLDGCAHGVFIAGVGDERCGGVTRTCDDGVQLGAGAERIGQCGVVGAGVDGEHPPALFGQGGDCRRADSSCGPGHQGDPVHGRSPGLSTHSVTTASKSAFSCSNSALPTVASAVLGSPSTPLVLT